MHRMLHRCHYTHRIIRCSFIRPLIFTAAYSKTPSHKSSRFGTLSDNVKNFLQNESKALQKVIGEPDISFSDRHDVKNIYQTLDPSIRSQLDRTFESHRKLLILLSYNPSRKRIDPEIYIDLHKRLDGGPLDMDQINLLIRRLTFHRKFDYIWKVIEDEGSTLTDIEDYIEAICSELKANDYLELGLLELIISAQEVIKSSGLKNSIIQTICFKHDRSRAEIEERIGRLVKYKSEVCLSNITESDPLMEQPGFISYVSSSFTIGQLVSSSIKFRLNGEDLEKVVDNSAPHDYYLLYPHYKEILKISDPEFVDKLLTSMIKHQATDNIIDCIQSLGGRMSNEILIRALAYIYFHTSNKVWVQIYLSISKKTKKRAHFTENLTKALLNSMENIFTGNQFETQALRFISLLQTNSLLQQNVLSSLLHCMDKPPTFTFYLELLKLDLSMTNFINLTEDICRRHSESDKFKRLETDAVTSGELYLSLFEEFLYLNFQRPREKGVHDYRKTYINSTAFERSRAIHRLHLFCKPISQLGPCQISGLLNSIEHHMFGSGDFTFDKTRYGRKHLFDKLVEQIMLEIDIKHSSQRGALVIQDIVSRSQFHSTSIGNELLYQYFTKYNPGIPSKLIAEFSDKKSLLTKHKMEGMMVGMLTSPLLLFKDRVRLYFEFCNHLKELGYTTATKKKPTIALIDLMVKIKVDNPKVEFSNFEDIMKIAMQRRVKKSLLLHWSRKLMLLEELKQ